MEEKGFRFACDAKVGLIIYEEVRTARTCVAQQLDQRCVPRRMIWLMNMWRIVKHFYNHVVEHAPFDVDCLSKGKYKRLSNLLVKLGLKLQQQSL